MSSEEYKEQLRAQIAALKQDRQYIVDFDYKLWVHGHHTHHDRDIFKMTLTIIDKEILKLEMDLVLEDMLSSDDGIEKMLEKVKNT